MSENSLSVNPVIEPFAGAVAGLGLGYVMAPRKYSLKRLILLKQDRFDKIYSNDVVKQMNQKEKQALDNIMVARKDYRQSKLDNIEDVRAAAKNWYSEYKKVDVPQEVYDTYVRTRADVKNAVREANYIELNKEYRAAKAAVKNSPNNEILKQVLSVKNEALAAAKTSIGAKLEHYTNAVKNLYDERLYNIKSNPTKWVKVKEAYNNFIITLAQRRTISSTKLFDLSNDKSLLKSYNAIKEFLPRSRTKSALTGAAILGGFTTLLAAHLTPAAHKA